MDSKGIINIELLFCTLIVILLLITNLPMIENGLNSNIEIHENSKGRILANHIADSINEVNSNEYGFGKKIKLPESIDGNFYRILVNERETIVEFNDKKGKSTINPIKLVDSSNKTLENIELYNGRTYLIEKTLVNDNKTDTINQSSILIRQVGN
ncbi:MAG: hypothetical protein PUB95_00855 [Methanobrevibacter ruminantium]|uniref:hypothetical protein n=1 Tax=Methanobrevibacter ruminantium TaxID=83816 RepID=UPI0026F2738B|nr:hypothetical protein [Methanobrevibacter ruminantium]MCI5737081.1 hypothetical protein [Methanobrevibacter ruminantium]MDD6047993.1 hypothetical protein [Methanobrevibacter ruminantium]